MTYQPIEDGGVIGNLRTVALVGRNGSIDWYCHPHFDSPSVFAAILDDKKGGWFRIFPKSDDVTQKQLYWPDTNVLVTRFLSSAGVGEITDYMPIGGAGEDEGFHGLVRQVKVVRGSMNFRMECIPAFNYARDSHTVELCEGGARFLSPNLNLALASDVELHRRGNGGTSGFALPQGETADLVLAPLAGPASPTSAAQTHPTSL